MSCIKIYKFLHFFSLQIQTTLAVVEEERDRFMAKLLNEEKARKELEGTSVAEKAF